MWAERDTSGSLFKLTCISRLPSSLFPFQMYGIHFSLYSSPGPNLHHYYSPSVPTGPTAPSGRSHDDVPLSPMYGAPYAAHDNGFKGLSAGLDFATLCKIILKVLIFKMIVKFIAVICMLLFLPKLDSGCSSTEDRNFPSKDDGLWFIVCEIRNVPFNTKLPLRISFSAVSFSLFSFSKVAVADVTVHWHQIQALSRTLRAKELMLIFECEIQCNIGCIKMIGGVKTHTEVSFPHGTKQQVFKFCAHAQSHSPLLSWSVT